MHLGELVAAHTSLERAIALYDPQQHRAQAWLYGEETGVVARAYIGRPLWLLGYPDQALQRSQQAVRLAREIASPFSQAFALAWAATVCQFRQEAPATQEHAETLIALSTEQRFPIWEAYGRVLRGWALAAQGQGEEGITQMRWGHDAWQATGAEVDRPYFLVLLAEAYGNVGQVNKGLEILTAASPVVDKGERYWEAERYRVKGELLLAHAMAQPEEAETNLHQALDCGPPPAGQVTGVAGCHEPGALVATPGQARRSPRAAGRRSTAGSLRALILPTSRRPGRS